jgi:hypothetical protein
MTATPGPRRTPALALAAVHTIAGLALVVAWLAPWTSTGPGSSMSALDVAGMALAGDVGPSPVLGAIIVAVPLAGCVLVTCAGRSGTGTLRIAVSAVAAAAAVAAFRLLSPGAAPGIGAWVVLGAAVMVAVSDISQRITYTPRRANDAMQRLRG